MRLYETTFLVNPQTADSNIERHVRDVADFITSNGGKIVYENRIGTRRLAYDIQGLSHAYYATYIFESEPPFLKQLERYFRLGEAYLRQLTILFEGNLASLQEEAAEAAEPRPERHAGPPPREEKVETTGPIGRREAPEESAPTQAAPAEETPSEEPAPLAQAETAAEPEPETAEAPEPAVVATSETPSEESVSPLTTEGSAEEPEEDKSVNAEDDGTTVEATEEESAKPEETKRRDYDEEEEL
jgi:small subunit ribosomal protein S6